MLPIKLSEKGKERLKEHMDICGNPFCGFLWSVVIIFTLNFFYAGMMFVFMAHDYDYWFYYKFLAVVYPFANIVTQIPLMILLKGRDKLTGLSGLPTRADFPILLNYYATQLKLSVCDMFSVPGMIINTITFSIVTVPSYFITSVLLNQTPLFACYAWIIVSVSNLVVKLCLLSFCLFNYLMDGETIITWHGDLMVELAKSENDEKV
jgi:hypothetical protein